MKIGQALQHMAEGKFIVRRRGDTRQFAFSGEGRLCVYEEGVMRGYVLRLADVNHTGWQLRDEIQEVEK